MQIQPYDWEKEVMLFENCRNPKGGRRLRPGNLTRSTRLSSPQEEGRRDYPLAVGLAALLVATVPFALAADISENASPDQYDNSSLVKIAYHPHGNSSGAYVIDAKNLSGIFGPKSTRREKINGVVKTENIASVKIPHGYRLSSGNLSEYAKGHSVFYALNLSGRGAIIATGGLENSVPEKIEFLDKDRSVPSTIGFNGSDYVPEAVQSEKTCYYCGHEDKYSELCKGGAETVLFAYVPKNPNTKNALSAKTGQTGQVISPQFDASGLTKLYNQ